MPPPIYTQTVVAFLWDFDRTLIPGYQQTPLFERYEIDEPTFWAEVNQLEDQYESRGTRVALDTAYLGHMITYAREGRLPGLNNSVLKDLGKGIEFCPGIPEFLTATRDHVLGTVEYARHGITVEHYIISTGLLKMIEGGAVGSLVDGIWANEFIDRPLPPGFVGQLDLDGPADDDAVISQVGYIVGDTTKTRAVFEINKGVNKSAVRVNDLVPEDERRIPIRNMIYVADGPSDVPVFSVINQYGGKTFGVWVDKTFVQVKSLERQGRINSMGPADYAPGSQTHRWLMASLDEIAEGIVASRERYLSSFPGAPSHTA